MLKQNQSLEFTAEKVTKKKSNKLYIQWKDYNDYSDSGFIKKMYYKHIFNKTSKYFPKTCKNFSRNIKLNFICLIMPQNQNYLF